MTDDALQMIKLLQIGTARASLPLGAASAPPLDSLLTRDGNDAPRPQEEHLWLALGALDLWNRAGHVPPPAPAAASPTPCETESLPACPPRAEATLDLLLRGVQPRFLLAEWLRLLQKSAARLPVRFLPNMLELATREAALRPLVTQVLGERGRWLAHLETEWEWAFHATGAAERDAVWQTGSLPQRIALLEDWRRADPAEAARALSAVWATEPAENRAALLPALGVGLRTADEPFLETALADRRKEVRVVAQRLLSRLPGSALSRRMFERLAPLVQVERPLLRAPRLALILPAEPDAATARDGVGTRAHAGLGQKAGWVVDMLAAVDPVQWCATLKRPAGECVAMGRASEFGTVFVRGWANAVLVRAEGGISGELLAWLEALGTCWIEAGPELRQAYPDKFFCACSALSAGDAHELLARLVEARGNWTHDLALIQLLQELAGQVPGPWPPGLSRRALERVRVALPHLAPAHNWLLKQALEALAAVLDPGTVADSEQGLRASIDPASQELVDQFFSIVHFRHEMSLSFQEQA